MKQQKFFWKVVRKLNNRYVSAYANSDILCHYRIGKKTIPKIGKLFVFDTRENARNLKRNTLHRKLLHILKVRIPSDSPMDFFIKLPFKGYDLTPKQLREWWTGGTLPFYYNIVPLPKGTILVDELTPVEKVR